MICPTPTKQQYMTLRDATAAALDVLRDYGSPQRPYQCECDAWHLTTRPMFNSKGPLTAKQVRELAQTLNQL